MKTAAKLDDFAHDLCVSGLGLALVSVVGIAVSRPAAEPRRTPRHDLPAPLSWTEAGTTPIVSASLIRSSTPRPISARAREAGVIALEVQTADDPQRILLAGESTGADSTTAQR